MPTLTEGLYELVLEQDYLSQSIINVFHYVNALGDDDLQGLCADSFDQDILPGLSIIQSDSLSYTNIRVANLTGDLADANLTPATTQGLVNGEDVTTFMAAPFRYNRLTKDTRNGSKRFAGLVEANTLTVGFLPAYLTALQLFATLLDDDISVPGGIFEPVILSKPDNPPGTWTYNPLDSVTALNRTTSQNSRKRF